MKAIFMRLWYRTMKESNPSTTQEIYGYIFALSLDCFVGWLCLHPSRYDYFGKSNFSEARGYLNKKSEVWQSNMGGMGVEIVWRSCIPHIDKRKI